MEIAKVEQILKEHGVPCYISPEGRVIADSMLGGFPLWTETVDATEWTRAELYDWLGY